MSGRQNLDILNVRQLNYTADYIYHRGQPVFPISSVTDILPVGIVMMWPTNTPPTNWLLCNGGAVPANYPDLISILNTTLHPGLKPDFQGRFPAMEGSHTGAPSYILSTGNKTENSGITINEMPPHVHNIPISNVPFPATDGVDFDATAPDPSFTNSMVSDVSGNGHPYAPPYYSINFIIYAGEPSS